MSDAKKELFELGEKSMHFSQVGSIQEASLAQLREQIKKVMIPLLIKTFQSQMDLPASRKAEQDATVKEAYEQLAILDHDLKNLHLWCQSCRSQIQRALKPPEKEQKNIVASPDLKAHPGIDKSFSEAMAAKSSSDKHPSTWWKTLLKK